MNKIKLFSKILLISIFLSSCKVPTNKSPVNKSDENMIQRSIDFISGATYKLESDIVFVGKESILVTTKKSNLIVKKDLTKGDKKEI